MTKLRYEELFNNGFSTEECCKKIEDVIEQDGGLDKDFWGPCFDEEGNLLPGHPLAEAFRNKRMFDFFVHELRMRGISDEFMMSVPLSRIRNHYFGCF